MLRPLAAALAVLLFSATCRIERQFTRGGLPRDVDSEARYLKAHMRNGDLYVLKGWQIDEAKGRVTGQGVHYDDDRRIKDDGPLVVPLAEVALFETNADKPHAPTVAALTVVAVSSAALSIACLANPKTCFGSCPTFYVADDGPATVAAESFSASVAPALEARDVDALHRARPKGRQLRLRVTNEALETHVIKQAELLVAPRPPDGRVVATADGRFWRAHALSPPRRCRASEGDCLADVRAIDERERGSRADGADLAARETIELTFDAVPGARRALVIEARQTFITTFLMYQALAYMGTRAGTYLAALERGDQSMKQQGARLFSLLGDIEVQAPDGRGGWRTVGGFQETGPIARELQLVPLPEAETGARLRLRLTRGHWRIGHLALATLGQSVSPTRVRAGNIRTASGDPAAARDWLERRRPALVTGPGDEHELHFTLPADAEDLELFLDSRGYYIEWMREPWLAEESQARLALLFTWPERALRELAPAYKQVEPQIEAMFWRSRYVRPQP